MRRVLAGTECIYPRVSSALRQHATLQNGVHSTPRLVLGSAISIGIGTALHPLGAVFFVVASAQALPPSSRWHLHRLGAYVHRVLAIATPGVFSALLLSLAFFLGRLTKALCIPIYPAHPTGWSSNR